MNIIGRAVPRVDGPLKVSGTAKYTADHNFPNMVYAVPLGSTIAKGKITAFDDAAARAMPGVVEIFHRGNIGKLNEPTAEDGMFDEARPPLADDVVSYYGQYVALVVAETFEQATAAATRIRVDYAREEPNVALELSPDEQPNVESERGDPAAAFASAPVTIDHTYVTPAETHNPIELHATVAIVEDDCFTFYETTQGVDNSRSVLSAMLGVPAEDTRVVMRFLGSGFGGKLWPWPQAPLAAAAARRLKRPVKVVVTRKGMFESVGHRPRTQQRVRMSALADGTLTSLRHEYVNDTGMLDTYEENCGEATPFFYGTPNLLVSGATTRRNIGAPTAMRGPGAVPGLFATESAYDELAIALDMDPVKLRLHNEPDVDQARNIPFSSRHYAECLTEGAQRFGWSGRTPQVGSMRENGEIIGWGMAGCSWLAARFPAEVRVDLRADGTARVASATQDIGTGTYTVLAQLVAQETGIPLGRVVVELGDTRLPPGPLSGGSMVTASVIPATFEATRAAMKSLAELAVKDEASHFAGHRADDVTFADGKLSVNGKSGNGKANEAVPFDRILHRASVALVSGSGKSKGTFGDKNPKFSFHSYGAQFVEIGWRPEIARLRVRRMVSVIDGGRVINERMARNQIEGALIMGVGMALLEQTRYEPRSGAPINSNLADYIVATHADAPELDVTFLDYPDTKLNELGARGLGEIGLAGAASAIAAAVYHATGVRVRTLPIEIEKVLAG